MEDSAKEGVEEASEGMPNKSQEAVNMELEEGGSVQTANKPVASSSEVDSKPENIVKEDTNGETGSKTIETDPKDLETDPKDLETASKDLENPSKELETASKDIETASKNLETTSKDIESNPKDIETSSNDLANGGSSQNDSGATAILGESKRHGASLPKDENYKTNVPVTILSRENARGTMDTIGTTTETEMVGASVANPNGEIVMTQVRVLQRETVEQESAAVALEDTENAVAEEVYRNSSNFQNKRRQRNPIGSRFSKRKKSDTKLQPSNGHLRFEEKEYPLLEYTDYLQAQMEIETHFNKKFSFNNPSARGYEGWALPPVETMFTKPMWQDKELQSTKETLNKVKEQLTEKDVASWHTHTKNTNPAEKVAYSVRRRANPEMVTQAWLKFYEIASTYPIIPSEEEYKYATAGLEGECGQTTAVNTRIFNSVHLCEAPGAFIVALNHYLALNRPSFKWQWLGNSLNPYYEGSPAEVCVVEDRFICYTLANWSFGRDSTGNLMEPENLEDLLVRTESMGPIDLVTADGSIDCQASPAEQEVTTHDLHKYEVLTALSILAPGGSLVLKKFTMFETNTVNLMYLLCCVFSEVHVLKPGTSKEGNSEVYVICLKYCGKEMCSPYLEKLVEVYGTSNDLPMFSHEELPEEFLVQLRKCAEVFKAYQINTITKNIALFERMTERDEQYNDLLKVKANAMFLDLSNCVHISRDHTLTDSKVNKSRYLVESDLNKPITSSLVRTKCPQSKLELLNKYINAYIEEFSRRNWIIDITKAESYSVSRLESKELDTLEFDVVCGKPFTAVKFSKFCFPKVQEAYRELCKLWESVDDHPICIVDDSLIGWALAEHPGAEILRGKLIPGPTSETGALRDAFSRIREMRIPIGGSLILFNVTLLTRLQYGALLILGSAFQNIAFYTGNKLGNLAPVLVLENFKSIEHGAAVLDVLSHLGWNPFDGEIANCHHQLVSYCTLMENLKLCSMYHYNLHHCLHRSLMLVNVLNGKWVMKSKLDN